MIMSAGKRFLTVALSMILACCLFTGCTQSAESTSTSVASSTEATTINGEAASADAAAKAIAQRIAEAKKSGKYPTVTMAFMNFKGAPSGLSDVVAAINKVTEPKLGLDVNLIILDAATYKQQLTLMLSSGEKLDLFNVIALGYTSSINNGYCLDLEAKNLISTYGQNILKTIDKSYLDGCRVGGVLYGLPNQRDMAMGLDCYAVGAKYLDGIGFNYKALYTDDADEIVNTDLATLDQAFVQMNQKYPDKAVVIPRGDVNQACDYDALGNDNFGVLLNLGKDLKVEDLFSSETYQKYCNRYYQWNKAGYISKDALTNSLSAVEQVKADTAISYPTAGKPGIRAQESGLCGQPMVIFQLGENMVKSSYISGLSWSMNSSTKDSIAAMQFLDAVYSDPEISNLLCWGIEGVHYQKTADGHIDFASGVDANNSAYFNNVNWEMPNQFIAHIFVGDELNIWDRMADFNAKANMSKALGFTFDNSALTTEYTALTNIYNQYQKQLEYGFVDPVIGIKEMVDKMQSAGLQKYIDAKKTALEAWAAK